MISNSGYSPITGKGTVDDNYYMKSENFTKNLTIVQEDDPPQYEIDEVLKVLADAGMDPVRRKKGLHPGKGIFPKTIEKMKAQIGKQPRASLKVSPNYLAEEHHFQYGSPWANGKADFDMLKGLGLRPEHTLLEIACGSLRSGIHYIRYLKAGHYYCIERDEYSLRAGIEYELPLHDLFEKDPKISW
eukprot:CAMPEP_0196595620 /NCGR_PEP_ID=MMETSP1081-20130531/81635_1 /TAXON_ID=36882 /ORGANISM="Pyramimonas amylifera, Strain CCMP720" /LENGTH=186 /DNA_ID=CAMNT_0041920255 /DNA_START=411 /DNA_END=968 /DNA_ORIENTATION=-